MIYGKRIRLRGVEKIDIPRSFEWINDPEVNDGLAIYLPMSLQDEEQWFERISQRDQAEKPMAIELREGEGWRLIGNCGVFNIEWMHRAAELGIMIGDKTVWNKGYGTEIMQLLLQHGFETLNLNRIYLRVYSTNPRAIRAYQKAGFVLEGTLRQAAYRHGKYADVHVMSVLRSEWNSNEAKK
ncbi:MAG TPA: GNAT family protein [Anaerolineales bacterium]|nr:GNAT family protein [Anaerolineales bacterium]